MGEDEVDKIKRALSDQRVSVRLRALNCISEKQGSRIALKVMDERIVPILIQALSDADKSVQRSAAFSLRPWVQADPKLFGSILPHYATNSFDGTYTHVGLYDVQHNQIWIPRFQAAKGHASLLSDGNTDRFFKFAFYVPGQAPRRFVAEPDHERRGHLLLHFILDWSYSRQCLISSVNDRRIRENFLEQQHYASAVMHFYRDSYLPYDVAVHRLVMTAGVRPTYACNVDLITASANARN